MATISKFYLLDATSPNTGTLPSGGFLTAHSGAGTDASGFATSRDATDVAGASNPDLEATGTAAANTTAQVLSLRRFVSRPLAARTFASSDGSWTFDFACFDSNTSHNQGIQANIYAWRPGTGARVGTGAQQALIVPILTSATTETHFSSTISWTTSLTILDGDILVFEVSDSFTQSMSSAYTTSFSYNGTTEASITTCASFITPPSALTLFTPAAGSLLIPTTKPTRYLM